jgi:hypothetical protein
MIENQQQTLNDILESMNDIYIILPDKRVAYLTLDNYKNPDRVVESVSVDGEFIKRVFLNYEGVYPSNLLSPAVTKVIEWNLEDSENLETGYFIDLRKLGMNRVNMVDVLENNSPEADTPIPSQNLPKTDNLFIPVPNEKKYQLRETPQKTTYI